MDMRAKKGEGGWEIFISGDTCGFLEHALLAPGTETPWHFSHPCDDMMQNTNGLLRELQPITLMDALAVIRRGVEAYYHYIEQESAAELVAENAWMRQYEHNAEHFDEMVRQDMIGYT